MNFFTFTKLGRAVVGAVIVVAAVFVFSASADDALFYNLNSAGGSDFARLNVGGTTFGRTTDNSGEDSGKDFYFALKYQIPIKWKIHGGLLADWVWLGEEGRFFGFDIGVGANFSDANEGLTGGLGFSYGYELCLPNNLQILFGGAVGFWYDHADTYTSTTVGNVSASASTKYNGFNFLAPFIKIHWNSIELMYRGLLGLYYVDVTVRSGSGRYETVDESSDDGFDWNRHQVTIGYCFGKKKK